MPAVFPLIMAFQSTLPTRGSDQMHSSTTASTIAFQSTLPTRGSDAGRIWSPGRRRRFQSTLPTRGSDLDSVGTDLLGGEISIHAPHEGERPSAVMSRIMPFSHFNPRSPRGGATYARVRQARTSAHFNPRSPRGGATTSFGGDCTTRRHFNPRSPRGGAT